MAVNLSPVGGVAAQFFTNTGAVLTGGKLYTYLAGTTTPATTYTSSQGTIAWTNPIVLDAAGRVSGSGEIWLTDGIIYKFVLKDSTDVLIATYDNISGINSNSVAFVNQQEIITATAGQTVFNLSISYLPGTNSLSVFVDGVNQYGPGAQYAYTETDADTVTFTSGLHVGAEVKFTTTQQQSAGAVDAEQVSYIPPFTGSVATNVEAKLSESISVIDFGAVGDGSTDDTNAIQDALDAAAANGDKALYFPAGTYKIISPLYMPKITGLPGARPSTVRLVGDNNQSSVIYNRGTSEAAFIYPTDPAGLDSVDIDDLQILADNGGGGIKLQSDIGGLYLNRFFMNGCSAGQWAINHTTGIAYTVEISGCRFWNAYGYNGGVATFNGGININFNNCFISQQQKNGAIIAINNTKNITIDTIQIEGANSSTTAQVGIALSGYNFNLDVRNLYIEGNINKAIDFGTTNLTCCDINGVYAFIYAGTPSFTLVDASGSSSNRLIRIHRVVYNCIDTGAGSGYIINDPNHLCKLDSYFYNNSTGAQAARLWKQDFDYTEQRDLIDLGSVTSGNTMQGQIQLPTTSYGMFEVNYTIISADNNHKIAARFWVVWDATYTNNAANSQQVGTTISIGASAPTGTTCTVNTSGVVTIQATSALTSGYHLKYHYTQLADLEY